MIRILGSAVATILLGLAACSDGSAYLLMEKREMARGVRYDSLFLGIHFGMERQAFFDHCYQLNVEGKVKEGPENASVEYKLPEELPYPGRMNFYPEFDDNNRIYKMPVYFHYDAWAPWNKEQWSDSLLPAVVQLMKQWYGGEFLLIEPEDVENKSPVFVKVDGNRRIAIYKDGDMKVKAVFTDLSSPQAKRKKGGDKDKKRESSEAKGIWQ